MAVERKYERDIDLLLAEEFSVNPTFAQWFLKETKFAGRSSAAVADVFVSRADTLGESDLVVLFSDDDGAFAILVEDKVDAGLQPDQAVRYRQRADREVAAGFCDEYAIVLCAPHHYISERADLAGFDVLLSLERIAEALRQEDSARSQYRASFLETASTRRINNWARREDEVTDRFWAAAYDMATAEFPILEMKPLRMTKDSTWINLRPADMPTMPKRVYIFLKGDRGQVDLTFSNTDAAQFHPLATPLLEQGMSIVKTSASAAIRLQVEGFRTSESIDAGMAKVRAAFAACQRLIEFYRQHRSSLDEAAREATPPAPPLRR